MPLSLEIITPSGAVYKNNALDEETLPASDV